jgi:cell division protein FtsX
MLTLFGGMIILVVIFTLVLGTLFIVYATQEWSKVFQGLCVITTLVLVMVITSFVTVVFTKLDDQSYYAAAVQIFLDESIDSLEEQDSTLLSRLQQFREVQHLTYESRSDLLENLRQFRAQGKAVRESQ